MIQRIFLTIGMVLSVIFLSLILLLNRDIIFTNPLNNTITIEYPSYVINDNDKISYIIDKSLSRIIKCDNSGNILYTIEGGSRSKKSFYNATEIIFDQDENLYVLNRELDNQGFFTLKESVIKYNKYGIFEKEIYNKIYNPDNSTSQLVQRGQLSGFQNNRESVSWFDINSEGVFHYKFNSKTEKLNFSKVFTFKKANIFISSICETENNEYIYITKQGKIYRYKNNQSVLLFSGDNEESKTITSTPWRVKSYNKNKIYFSDILNGTIKVLNEDGTTTNVLSKSIIDQAGLVSEETTYYEFYINQNDSIFTINNETIIGVNSNSLLKTNLSELKIPMSINIAKITNQIFLILLLAIFIICSSFFYIKVMNKKISLLIKQIFIFIPLTVAALIITSNMVFENMSGRYQKELTDRLSLMVQIISGTIDGDLFSDINMQQDFMNDSYQEIRSKLHIALNENSDDWNYGYYFALHKVYNGNIYSMMWLNDEVTTIHPFSYLNEPESVYIQALRGVIATEKAVDAWGLWMDAVGPIYDSEGNIVALLEIGKDYKNFKLENEMLFRKVTMRVLIISAIFIVFFIFISYFLLMSIRKLRNGALELSTGNWDVVIKSRGNDEVTDLTNSFNEMATSIKNYVTEIVDLNKAYFRFVPEEFLMFLNKSSVTEVNLGDQIQANMTIMFTDIRSFTKMSEKMTPKENFDFLNNYLGIVGPIVRKHLGFIDKYIGDAIMALYPHDADNAISTAIEIQHKLYDFNKDRTEAGQMPIEIGLGIHTGSLMLGILGEAQRVDSTVISDNVNLASRLEGLTKKFGAAIIVSESTMNSLENKEMFLSRYLGKIQVKGKQDAVNIYEILDGLMEEEKSKKIETRNLVEEAINVLLQKDFTTARKKLLAAHKIDSNDKAILFYYKLCKRYEKYPEKFTLGAVSMSEK